MSTASTYTIQIDSIIRYVNIFAGSTVFISGMLGNILNAIVFLSLKTFRKNPCAFCLMILSISDCGILVFNTLPSIFVNIFRDHGDANAMFPCQIAISFGQVFGSISHIIMCYAAIDQCISTSLHKTQRSFTLKRMRCLIIIGILASTLYGIPFVLHYQSQPLPGTNTTVCLPDDKHGVFAKYLLYVGFPIVNGFLPLTIMSVFGLLAFRNVRKMTKKSIPITRLRSEQQLTAMVLIKILNFCILVVPFLIVYIVRYIVASNTDDGLIQKQFQLVNRVFTMLFFANYADDFYIFFVTSARFRRQLKFVLIDIHLKRWREKINRNQVRPFETQIILSIASSFAQT